MKYTLLILTLFMQSINLFGADENLVTLTVNGEGETKEIATHNALRNAIEQTFGVFISSNTQILNEELVKDEIISISNGSIQSFDILSETLLSPVNIVVSLKAIVSVTNLASYAASKGVVVEFKGNLFAFNIKQQILNEENEIKAINHLTKVIHTLTDKAFDYKLKVDDPKSKDDNNQRWDIGLSIDIYPNDNLFNLTEYLFETLNGIGLSNEEADKYVDLKKKLYPISIEISKDKYAHILLRKKKSFDIVYNLIKTIEKSILKFTIENGVDKFNLQYKNNNLPLITFRHEYMFNHNDRRYINDHKEILLYTVGKLNYDFTVGQKRTKNKINISEKKLYINTVNLHKDLHSVKAFLCNGVSNESCGINNESPAWLCGTNGAKADKNYSYNGFDNNVGISYFCVYALYQAKWLLDREYPFISKLTDKMNCYPTMIVNKDRECDKVDIYDPGLIISFIGFDRNTIWHTINHIDERTLDEINKITEYKVSTQY